MRYLISVLIAFGNRPMDKQKSGENVLRAGHVQSRIKFQNFNADSGTECVRTLFRKTKLHKNSTGNYCSKIRFRNTRKKKNMTTINHLLVPPFHCNQISKPLMC